MIEGPGAVAANGHEVGGERAGAAERVGALAGGKVTKGHGGGDVSAASSVYEAAGARASNRQAGCAEYTGPAQRVGARRGRTGADLQLEAQGIVAAGVDETAHAVVADSLSGGAELAAAQEVTADGVVANEEVVAVGIELSAGLDESAGAGAADLHAAGALVLQDPRAAELICARVGNVHAEHQARAGEGRSAGLHDHPGCSSRSPD